MYDLKVCDSYVVVDLETTGLSPDKDKILEIGAVKVVQGAVVDTFCTFVNPGMEVPFHIQNLTGITTEMVQDAPSAEDAFGAFLTFSEGMDLMGHNLKFDYGFLKYQAERQKIPFEKNGIDTLKIARILLLELEKKNLSVLCDYFHVDNARAHRAYHDAQATHEVYTHLCQRVTKDNQNLFWPVSMQVRVKKQSPITNAQKGYLNDLLKYHKITMNVPVDSLSKSEASRKIDQIISQYGRIVRR